MDRRQAYDFGPHRQPTGVYDSTNTTRKAAFSWDALGRRIEFVNDVLDSTTRYFFDGVNEIAEFDGDDNRSGHYVHGISYVDERLLRVSEKGDEDTPFYYVLDRMYNVRLLLDRAGSIVERYAYDSYGRPRIRESCGRGDMNNDTKMSSGDTTRFDDANDDTIWDPRADMDDDGDVDPSDETLYDKKYSDWSGAGPPVDPRQAFSDKGNPFMFQGIPHFALDTASSATEGKLMLNHHRARFADPMTGRWTTRDRIGYIDGPNLFHYARSNPIEWRDPDGFSTIPWFGPAQPGPDCDQFCRQDRETRWFWIWFNDQFIPVPLSDPWPPDAPNPSWLNGFSR